MAQQVREIKISWENNDSIKIESQLDSGGWETILEMDEDGHLGDLWANIQVILEKYFTAVLNVIGSEMKA